MLKTATAERFRRCVNGHQINPGDQYQRIPALAGHRAVCASCMEFSNPAWAAVVTANKARASRPRKVVRP